jgi:flagellar biosynthetic protein FliR
MSLLESFLLNQFLLFTLILARVSGLVMIAPIFGGPPVPMQIRALLAVALSLLMTTAYSTTAPADPGTLLNYLVQIGGEALVGVALGLGVLILLAGVHVAGQIISQLSGMSLADVYSPDFDEQTPLFSQMFFYLTMAIFVLIGGHRLVMAALLDTLGAIPPGSGVPTDSLVEALTTVLSQSFLVGIRAAAPAMTALLLSTLVLGLVSRTLPQLNIIAVGFGLNSLITLGALFLSIGGIAWAFQDQVVPMLDLLQQSLVNNAD